PAIRALRTERMLDINILGTPDCNNCRSGFGNCRGFKRVPVPFGEPSSRQRHTGARRLDSTLHVTQCCPSIQSRQLSQASECALTMSMTENLIGFSKRLWVAG